MNKTELKKLIDEGFSYQEIANHFGKGYSTVRKYVKKYNIPYKPKYKIKHKWTKEKIIFEVSRSKYMADLCRNLGITPAGGSYQRLKALLNTWQINTDHFKYINTEKGCIPCSEILVFNRNNSGQRTKTSLLKRCLKENNVDLCSCNSCGLTCEWQGIPLTLHIDHVNGNKLDNRVENLRFLCPNCHSQTDTYAGRNLKKTKILRDCKGCGGEFKVNHKSQIYCSRDCATKNMNRTGNRKRKDQIKWPPVIDLIKMVKESNYVQASLKLNCSDNAIRKHLKRNGYDPKTLKINKGG